jgi:hypothetical protein
MITAIVQYRQPPSIDQAACAAHFRKIAEGFRVVPGRIRKEFIYAEDGWAGGVYLWKTRAQAEAFYSGPWLDRIRERYGMDPQIRDFNTTCITDNSADAAVLPEAADQFAFVAPRAGQAQGIRSVARPDPVALRE